MLRDRGLAAPWFGFVLQSEGSRRSGFAQHLCLFPGGAKSGFVFRVPARQPEQMARVGRRVHGRHVPHLDVAGTAWLDDAKPGMAKGLTGLPVASFVTLALNWK
jgi:hypothetical protein